MSSIHCFLYCETKPVCVRFIPAWTRRVWKRRSMDWYWVSVNRQKSPVELRPGNLLCNLLQNVGESMDRTWQNKLAKKHRHTFTLLNQTWSIIIPYTQFCGDSGGYWDVLSTAVLAAFGNQILWGDPAMFPRPVSSWPKCSLAPDVSNADGFKSENGRFTPNVPPFMAMFMGDMRLKTTRSRQPIWGIRYTRSRYQPNPDWFATSVFDVPGEAFRKGKSICTFSTSLWHCFFFCLVPDFRHNYCKKELQAVADMFIDCRPTIYRFLLTVHSHRFSNMFNHSSIFRGWVEDWAQLAASLLSAATTAPPSDNISTFASKM